MREFDGPIGRAWRRMRLQRFLGVLVWCALAGLSLGAVAVAVVRFSPLSLPGAWWLPLAVGAALAVLAAALIAALSGPSRHDAAVAIDHAFGLNERLSTALALPDAVRQSPVGQALVQDAIRHVEALDIGSRFGLTRPRLAWIPIVPALLALGLAALPEDLLGRALAAAGTARKPEAKKVDKQAVQRAMLATSKRLEEKKKALTGVEATETAKLVAELQKAVEDLAKSPPADKQQAMVQLNKLADAVKERQKELGQAEQMSRQLEQLKDLGKGGPADSFAKELAKGDYQKAAEQLKQLGEKLAKGELSEPQKEQLKQQLGAMKQQLEQMANQEQRQQQLKEALEKGQISKEMFEQQMAKLQQQSQQMQQLQGLASKLGEAQKQMAQGDMKKAAEALGTSEQQLKEMAQAMQQLEALDGAMADLQDAKNGMNGEGSSQIGEGLEGSNLLGQGNRPGGTGNGMGRGRGQGDRPEAPDDTAAYDSKVRQQITKGKAILGGFSDPSKQVRGESLLEIQGQVEAAAGAAAEALTDQKIPGEYKKHVQGYFDRVRKGGN